METSIVGAYEAKTHLPSLLDRVAKGEQITITRHGVPNEPGTYRRACVGAHAAAFRV
jgi:hypothetical protein